MTTNGNNSYDLVVIGSGPAGQKAAICAAKMRKKVAVIERKRSIGGVCVNTGTIPSKTFREAVLYLSGLQQRSFYGRGYAVKDQILMHDLVFRSDAVMAREIEVIKSQLRRNRVTVIEGSAKFVADHKIEVENELGSTTVHGDYFVIACGTRPAHDEQIPIDGKRIFDSDQVHDLPELPRELIVVGAGIIGLEYASMFAALGVKVTLLDQRPLILEFADREIVESLCFQLRQLGTVFRLGEKVVSVGFDEERDRVFAKLESGKTVHGQALLYAVGRRANSDQLNLGAIGLHADERGKLKVDRALSDGGAVCVRGGGRDRISGAGEHVDGAGKIGELQHFWRGHGDSAEPDSVWRVHDSGDFDGGRDRGATDAGRRFPMKSGSPAMPNWPRGRCWAMIRDS